MDNTGEAQDRLGALERAAEEQLFWLRLLGMGTLRQRVERLLATGRDRRIYELTDGSHSTTEIAKAVGISQPAVSNIWTRWRAEGIVVEVPAVKGRCKHVVGLAQLGLSSPQPAQPGS